ncbi:MAG: hypothetical protein K2K88_06240 [Muribaculaceae bacterium]|nr:hypothetical protein [Muribaculaceae bacterium]MDE6643507.1 hypothetical protein [Muribaculaceae bacterium]
MTLTADIVDLFNRRFPQNDHSTELILAIRPMDYSGAMLARAVEDCNANVINLNVTGERTEDGYLLVDLRVDVRNGEAVARSLERYGFEVIDFVAPDGDGYDSARDRANEILRILDI